MEDVLFDERPSSRPDPREAQKRSFATRKALVRLRRVAQPMRELVVRSHAARGRATASTVNAAMQPYYQDVYDHVLRVNDTIEGLRDLITTIYETRLALNDHSLNTVTRQLAAWAAIIAVPTAVTGFYGQNIPYPGFAGPQRLLDQHRHLGRGLGPALRDVPASTLAVAVRRSGEAGSQRLRPCPASPRAPGAAGCC